MKIDTSEVVRLTLAVLVIGVLTVVSVWILRPFLPAVIWATMIVVPTWRAMRAVQARLWGSRALAVVVMTLALVAVFVAPLWAAMEAVVSSVDTIAAWAKGLSAYELRPAPAWVENLPLIGHQAAASWNEVAAQGMPELGRRLWPYAQKLVRWVVTEHPFGVLALQFLLTTVIAAIFYATGERAVEHVLRFGRRLAGERGERAIWLAGQAIRAVALGIVVTAFAQSVIGGVGLAIAGVPFAGVLTAVMFFLAIVQIGAGPVMLIATIWLFWRGEHGWGIALGVWTVVVASVDNILRPLLIRRGSNLPLLLIIAGVVGGLIAFGPVGIFVGPIVLAVTYALLDAWVQDEPREIAPGNADDRANPDSTKKN